MKFRKIFDQIINLDKVNYFTVISDATAKICVKYDNGEFRIIKTVKTLVEAEEIINLLNRELCVEGEIND